MSRSRIRAHTLPHARHDGATYGTRYEAEFAALAASHRGRPTTDIVPLLRRAADRALLGFAPADLQEQAQAISSGAPCRLRITLP
ncbi:hypothetical protein [Streptomyces candidus]|uniref:Uncharacterized protein n=1 Tax=Streptomyces candidus TaxID=67283 RepID=A0A7X0LPK0_9ACTN|nr:hypothetical protein [Streptomyces candidus]MBB6436065.1 hypothetical protein [Streptomyces candidus]GHH43515.1 hypothetical protein GCM10018773_29700 [Streptomyces candidus]